MPVTSSFPDRPIRGAFVQRGHYSGETAGKACLLGEVGSRVLLKSMGVVT